MSPGVSDHGHPVDENLYLVWKPQARSHLILHYPVIFSLLFQSLGNLQRRCKGGTKLGSVPLMKFENLKNDLFARLQIERSDIHYT